MKPVKISKKHLPDIEFVKMLIEHNDKYQDSLIDRIAENSNIKSKHRKEILWDYIYNGSDWTIEFTDEDTK